MGSEAIFDGKQSFGDGVFGVGCGCALGKYERAGYYNRQEQDTTEKK